MSHVGPLAEEPTAFQMDGACMSCMCSHPSSTNKSEDEHPSNHSAADASSPKVVAPLSTEATSLSPA